MSKAHKCAVIGAFGNYGGVAACLASTNCEVQIIQDAEDLHPVHGLRRIEAAPYSSLLRDFNLNPCMQLADATGGGRATTFRFAAATSNYSAVADADILLLVVPSLFHEAIGLRLRGVRWTKPLTVITFTDRSMGAVACWCAAGRPSEWRLLGVNATPFLAQKSDRPFSFRLLGKKAAVLLAAQPADMGASLLGQLKDVLPGYQGFHLLTNMFDLAMSANPALLHAVHELFILQRIADGDRVPMYDAHAFDQTVEHRLREVCAERMRIAAAFGLWAQSFESYERTVYTSSEWRFKTIQQNRNGNQMFRQLLSPVGLRGAKGIESVCCTLCFWESVALLAGMKVTAIPAIIDAWSQYYGLDLRLYGRTVGALGLEPQLVARRFRYGL